MVLFKKLPPPPCEGCICIPICRHRTLSEILSKCTLLKKYYFCRDPLTTQKPDEEAYNKRIKLIEIFMPGWKPNNGQSYW